MPRCVLVGNQNGGQTQNIDRNNMAEISPSFNVTAAFHSQLNTLCIREFPCGYGSWVSLNISLGKNAF